MPSFDTEVPHSLGRDEAMEKLKNFLDNVAKLYKDQVSDLEGTWFNCIITRTSTVPWESKLMRRCAAWIKSSRD